MSCSRWKRRRRNHTSSLGNSYFVISPRPVGYFTFMYRNAMFFASITTSQYAKALPQSALVVLWPYPLRFSFNRPDWGSRTLGWDTTLGTIACRARRCRTPSTLVTLRHRLKVQTSASTFPRFRGYPRRGGDRRNGKPRGPDHIFPCHLPPFR